MKTKITFVVMLLVSLVVLLPEVNAYDWSKTPINSGYAITTDWFPDEVPIGEPVTARAGTTDLSIVTVWFRWLRPNGTEAWPPINVTEFTLDTWNDKIVRVFLNTQYPDEVGDWGIQAIFYDANGTGIGPLALPEPKVAIRARSFFAVPEVPLGTIAIIIAMFGALTIFAIKKKHIPLIRRPL